MKVFLIILAVLIIIVAAVLSLSATVTLVYDKGWHTRIKVLFIEKDIVLSKILSKDVIRRDFVESSGQFDGFTAEVHIGLRFNDQHAL